MADLLNAAYPAEIKFGNNMTTLTMHLARSIAASWRPATRSSSRAWTTRPTWVPGAARRRIAASSSRRSPSAPTT